MISYRHETQTPSEPSVRFYKIIALSFLGLTIVLLGVVIFMTSKKADIIITAKQDSKRVNLSVAVGPEASGELSLAGRVYAEPFAWSQTFHPTGDKTVLSQATGTVVIYNKTAINQPLVKTTRLLTKDGILFRLSERVVVPANGSAEAAVYADQSGPASEIGPSQFTIPGLAAPKQALIYAESQSAMTGGEESAGVLSDNDIKNALSAYQQKSEQAFLNKLQASAASGTNFAVAISDSSAKASSKAGDEVSRFNVAGTSTMVVVSYRGSDLDKLLAAAVQNQVNAGTEKFLTIGAEPEVSVSDFDLSKNTADLAVYQDAVVTLDSSAQSLWPAQFMGKSKDEITRYVLGLPHVASVDVQFSPGWMMSAPSVADRIKVVVKNVQ